MLVGLLRSCKFDDLTREFILRRSPVLDPCVVPGDRLG